jgi:hypothetical protein
MKRFTIVFSNEPEDAAAWVARACEAAKLRYVDNDRITTEISRIPEAQKQLLQSNLPPGENPALAPHYLAALEKVSGNEPRVGLYSMSWLLYLGRADGCVLDFTALEAQRTQGLAAGMKQKEVDDYVAKFTQQLQERARKYVPPERILMLPMGEPEARKVERASDFIRKLS